MNIIFLAAAVLTSLTVLRKIISIERIKPESAAKKIKKNAIMMVWGLLLVFCILFIPYQTWILTGRLNDWNGVYILGASATATVILCFSFYFKFKTNKAAGG
ncbi:hypothetical protein [Domibacillus indicus]|uniref:hypothetical protein n=1 Tax=Domibacillus indicus TaxID=1437523 RepID=UPI0006182705|nr:hypothetical protein [Domibacillus indicus]